MLLAAACDKIVKPAAPASPSTETYPDVRIVELGRAFRVDETVYKFMVIATVEQLDVIHEAFPLPEHRDGFLLFLLRKAHCEVKGYIRGVRMCQEPGWSADVMGIKFDLVGPPLEHEVV